MLFIAISSFMIIGLIKVLFHIHILEDYLFQMLSLCFIFVSALSSSIGPRHVIVYHKEALQPLEILSNYNA